MIQNRHHADPPGTSLALSDRLAGNQPHRPLRAGGGPVRALPASAWAARHAPRRCRWRLVGYRDPRLARWSWKTASPSAWLRFARRRPQDTQARLSCDRPPQPRPDLQRPALAQSRSALPALPHDPRRGRASSAPLVERVPQTGDRRPLFGSLQLEAEPSARVRTWAAKAASEERMPAALRFNFAGGTHDRDPSNPQDDRHGTTPARR